MRTTIHIGLIAELQPGIYRNLDERLAALAESLAGTLTSEHNDLVCSVLEQECIFQISPD